METLALVTSCHNYGRYLDEWADSIIGQEKVWPDVVAIVDNGSTDTSPHQIAAAAEKMREAGIRTVTRRIPLGNFGVGRNEAVRLSQEVVPTEWVMHFDADDTLMPHALTDWAELAPKADVVGFGYVRSGDLSSGPRNKRRTYSAHRGAQTRKSNAPCSGVSPFRRWLWEASPYREDMRGGWDTALWLGFSWHDARFVPTTRPVFYYRQHGDSVFNRRRISKRRSRFVGTKLENLRRPIEGVSVIIPWQESSPERSAALEWVRRRYETLHPEWEVVIGECEGQWRKGAAVAAGIEQSRGVVAVIADADCVVPPEALEEAVQLVATTEAPWVVPHTMVHRLDQPYTDAVLASDPAKTPDPRIMDCVRKPYEGFAGGGIVVVDRSDYEAAGGIPLRFVGWGAEDEALAVILDSLVGPHHRLPYDLTHLWHPRDAPTQQKQRARNRETLNVLRGFAADPNAMWDCVQHLAAGGDPLKLDRAGKVVMRAIEDFQRGREVVKAGDIFLATETEARRMELRGRKQAKRASGVARELMR